MFTIIGNNNLKEKFNCSIKPNIAIGHKERIDPHGVKYLDTFKYIPDMVKISPNLYDITLNEPACVGKIISYIVKHVVYNTDNIILKPSELCEELHEYKPNISKALARLKELSIIQRACEQPQFKEKVTNKYLYFVNSNYITNGNAEVIDRDWNTQYGGVSSVVD